MLKAVVNPMTSVLFPMKLCVVGLFFLLSGSFGFAAPPALIPLPQILQTNSGSYTLCPSQVILGAPAPAATIILVDGVARETGEYLAMTLFKSTGYRFQIASNTGVDSIAGTILLTTNNALSSLGSE